ncbi:MAG: DUF3789 domain-containing protein [Ruminococcus sp.]
MLKFLLGLLIGGNIGIFTMALMQINRGEPYAD